MPVGCRKFSLFLSITHTLTTDMQMQTTTFPNAIDNMNDSFSLNATPPSRWASSVSSSPSPNPALRFSADAIRFKIHRSFLLHSHHHRSLLHEDIPLITRHPDPDYLTMVWEAGDRPSEYRPASWVYPHPLEVEREFFLFFNHG
jgi:hypothetical protein